MPDPTLPPARRRLHRALLDWLLATGAVWPEEELARAAGVDPATLPELMAELVAADYVATDGAGKPVCLYPLSPAPTPHLVRIDGQPRYAMCAIDALGIPAMRPDERGDGASPTRTWRSGEVRSFRS